MASEQVQPAEKDVVDLQAAGGFQSSAQPIASPIPLEPGGTAAQPHVCVPYRLVEILNACL